MSIQLVTYANQTVTPTNDAIIYERAIDQNGIFYGCNVTVSSNNVNITGGYGIVCGREFTIQSESIAVTLAPSGTLEGRLYVRLDLADADAPIQLLTATGNTLPPLEQDADVNYVNGAYEMELATFTVGVSALSDVVETYEIIYGPKQAIAGLSAFNSLFFDIQENSFSPSVSNNADAFQDLYTATKDCIFIGYVHAAFASNATGRRAMRCYILENGTRTFNNIIDVRAPANGAATDVTLPVTVSIKAGQKFGVRLYQNSGSTQTVTCHLTGVVLYNS